MKPTTYENVIENVKNDRQKSDCKQFITRDTALTFRGIAAVMVILSHYAEWYSWFVQTEGNREIFRVALTKLGVYGVDVFFLLSGYAMVKSLGDKKINRDFIFKKIRNIYIPYLIITGVIELISGGFTSFHDFWLFASGYDYWFMNVLFVFYIGFIVIYALFKKTPLRIAAFGIFTYAYSYTMYKNGMYEFWYVSNITFVIGIITAECERIFNNNRTDEHKKFNEYEMISVTNSSVTIITHVIYLIMIIALGIAMFFVVKSGLYGYEAISRFTKEQQIWLKIGATIIWTLLVLLLTIKWRIKEQLFSFLGKYSLYLYLTHTYIFMRVVNSRVFADISPDVNTALMAKFAISAVFTVIVSALCGIIITRLTKMMGFRYRL
ncbi:MAG: acyltransferase [Lachnospiraceae bacterium]|nr:acyltransferase [Lachnospiraceae bacterium]